MLLSLLLKGLCAQSNRIEEVDITDIKKINKDKLLDNVLYIDYLHQRLCYLHTFIDLINFFDGLRIIYQRFYKKYPPLVIGVTGTSGKTTTCSLLYEALSLKYQGVLIRSSQVIYQKKLIKQTDNTTLPSDEMMKYLTMDNVEFAIIEVSSEGLDQNRLAGMTFDLVIFLNLYKEHLNYHHSLDNYILAKRKLLNYLKNNSLILCNERFVDVFKLPQAHTFNPSNIKYLNESLTGSTLLLEHHQIKCNLCGLFNLDNISCCYKALQLLKEDAFYLLTKSLPNFFIKGRMQVVRDGQRFFMIDYAHTSNEVKSVLVEVKKHTKGRLIVVIGCGGNKDEFKKHDYSVYATTYADYVIFTEDNSRDEPLKEILDKLVSHVVNNNYEVVMNRFDALKRLNMLVKDHDLGLILGKGDEIMIKGLTNKEFNDYDALKKILKNDDNN